MSHPPTTLDELLEQRDEDLVALIEHCVADGTAMDTDLQHGNVLAARYMLEAIGVRLGQMRRLLP